MKIALIYPPVCDPTAPYLSIPALMGVLRKHGVEVLPIDANIEAFDVLLRSTPLEQMIKRIERRFHRLMRKSSLSHVEHLATISLQKARANATISPNAIEDAMSVLRDRSGKRFYDSKEYETAITTVESALQLVSASYTPLVLDFKSYHTPFSLLSMEEIKNDAYPDRDPFHDYFSENLIDRLTAENIGMTGISVAFPGQIQPAFTLAFFLRQKLPHMYITIGGPAITQIFIRLKGTELKRALEPFDSVVLFEGELALLDLIRRVEKGERPAGIIQGERSTDMVLLPCPDFDGLPLEKYLSPEPVLPYDPTRGCYWGKCSFCHYGLTETGTAKYRERSADQVFDHLNILANKYRSRIFYLSQDSMAPDCALRLAKNVSGSKAAWRWATDMRPEPVLNPEFCQTLADGGALSIALGVESGSNRILQLIQKGVAVATIRDSIRNLSQAGISVELMAFTDFPTETYGEALDTLNLIKEMEQSISLFICGEFNLVHGAPVSIHPSRFGIREIWQVQGDDLGTGLFYEEAKMSKTTDERQKIDNAVRKLSRRWWLHQYPWAGSLSTAHTLFWIDQYGPEIFKQIATSRSGQLPINGRFDRSRFELKHTASRTEENESEIWNTLIRKKRKVTRAAYLELANVLPPVKTDAGQKRNNDGSALKKDRC